MPDYTDTKAEPIHEYRKERDRRERDSLTGLYERACFFRHAKMLDEQYPHTDMDAVVVDVHHFHMINARHGRDTGDCILRHIATLLKEVFGGEGAVVGRQGADIFLGYWPHRGDYLETLDYCTEKLAEDPVAARLCMGVYENVDKAVDMEQRFDRARSASHSLKDNLAKTLGFYDSAAHERELHAARLAEDFRSAIQNREFMVYFQPKFDIQGESPVLAGAETLVRWQHPKLGLISPVIFIPAFEHNGLIRELDQHVWRMAARQVRDWKERLGRGLCVSVNVSRVDLYDEHLPETLCGILAENGLTPKDMHLEITESAYTQDAQQVIGAVKKLSDLGFCIEMDDFGTGYSSLSMISSLPVDILKIDMQFIRDAFADGKNTRLVEIILEIADYLQVPAVAEGVETHEQLKTLKDLGCQLVQGYYFSRPLPPQEFEAFLQQYADGGWTL
ncbi:MAG: EAL domain-containing protein [Clostridia bacterium]|nr:EAL domain-containing protein [Clostridia bacterium]